MGDVEKSATKARSRISGLRGTVVLAVNAVNELKNAWNAGVGIGNWIWEKWEKNIKGIDRAAEKRKQEALDARIREENNATPPFKARRMKPPGILTFPGNGKPLTTSTNYTAVVWN